MTRVIVPVPTGRLQLEYEPFGLHHFMDLYCNVSPGGTGLSGHVVSLAGGGLMNADDAAAKAIALLKLYGAGANFVLAWTLYQRSGSSYIPVFTTAAATTGTGASGISASVATWSFRATNQELLKVVGYDLNVAVPTKSNTMDAIATSMLDGSSPELGSWVRSRDDHAPHSFKARVSTLSKRSRRRLGIL